MRMHRTLMWTRRVLLGLQIVCGLGIAASGVALDIQAGEGWRARWGGWQYAVGNVANWAPVSVIALSTAATALGFLRARVAPPGVWNAIQSVLDRWQRRAFGQHPGEMHMHRVTLYRQVAWRRCRGGFSTRCLLAVARSGHSTKKGVTIWPIPDDGKRQGVAGITYNVNGTIELSHLPDLRAGVTDDDYKTYAARTGMSKEDAIALRPKARSYLGIPIEVDGSLWGVIVLDSVNERTPGKNYRAEFHGYVHSLGLLLGRKLR